MSISNVIIDIHMVDDKGFIWNADDWFFLRTTYRLIGSLIGTLPSTPRQEDHNGLPCMLLPEEVRLMVENGIGRAVRYPSFSSLPDDHCEMLKNIEGEKLINGIKKENIRKNAHLISKLMIDSILTNGDKNCKAVKELNKEVGKTKQLDMSSLAILHLDELCSEVIEVSLPELMSNLETLRYKVFKDLWSKGYYLTCGLKFGGDFLVYKGDPLAFHAEYIVSCRDLNREIMISRSRVSSVTKKKMVLAKEDGESVEYLIYLIDDNYQNTYKKPIHFLLL